MKEYDALKQRLASGWNTWNTRSVLSHVLLPQAFALNLAVKTYSDGNYLHEMLIGREETYPGPHAYDGSYTELRFKWNGVEATVQSAHAGDGDLVLLVTPHSKHLKAPSLVVEGGILWNREGYVVRHGEVLSGVFGDTAKCCRASSVTRRFRST
jgi:hypothetical protein